MAERLTINNPHVCNRREWAGMCRDVLRRIWLGCHASRNWDLAEQLAWRTRTQSWRSAYTHAWTAAAFEHGPTVARGRSGSVVAIGSPGADRITTAILQSFLNYVGLGMNLQEAVTYPRLHVESVDGSFRVAYEPGLAVESLGYSTRAFDGEDMFFGGVAAVALHPDSTLEAGVDPRRSGAAFVAE